MELGRVISKLWEKHFFNLALFALSNSRKEERFTGVGGG